MVIRKWTTLVVIALSAAQCSAAVPKGTLARPVAEATGLLASVSASAAKAFKSVIDFTSSVLEGNSEHQAQGGAAATSTVKELTEVERSRTLLQKHDVLRAVGAKDPVVATLVQEYADFIGKAENNTLEVREKKMLELNKVLSPEAVVACRETWTAIYNPAQKPAESVAVPTVASVASEAADKHVTNQALAPDSAPAAIETQAETGVPADNKVGGTVETPASAEPAAAQVAAEGQPADNSAPVPVVPVAKKGTIAQFFADVKAQKAPQIAGLTAATVGLVGIGFVAHCAVNLATVPVRADGTKPSLGQYILDELSAPMDFDNMSTWIRAGALAVGLGGGLFATYRYFSPLA